MLQRPLPAVTRPSCPLPGRRGPSRTDSRPAGRATPPVRSLFATWTPGGAGARCCCTPAQPMAAQPPPSSTCKTPPQTSIMMLFCIILHNDITITLYYLGTVALRSVYHLCICVTICVFLFMNSIMTCLYGHLVLIDYRSKVF